MQIKICGLRTREDISAVNDARPDYAGFVVNFPKSRRSVSTSELQTLRKELDPRVQAVGVFVDEDPALIANLFANEDIDIAQLHGSEDEAYVEALRTEAPGIQIWQAFQVKDADDVRAAQNSGADMTLLDAGQGCGKTFDWTFLKEARRPYILAGGLTAERIRQASSLPGAVCADVSSGVETDGRKDPVKIMEAVRAARKV